LFSTQNQNILLSCKECEDLGISDPLMH
jgi:hypothetical protein